MTSKVVLALAAFLPMTVLAQETDIEFRSTVFVGSYVYQLDILRDKRGGPVRLQAFTLPGGLYRYASLSNATERWIG